MTFAGALAGLEEASTGHAQGRGARRRALTRDARHAALTGDSGGRGPLGQIANNLTPPLDPAAPGFGEDDRQLRSRITRMLETAAYLHPHDDRRCGDDGRPLPSRIALCSWSPAAGEVAPVMSVVGQGENARARVGGVQRCGSVWECPACSATIMGERTRELTHAVNWARGKGHFVYLVTLTVRHDWASSLDNMVPGIADAWSSVIRGAPWKRWRERLGEIHYVRRLEATHGGNGWHPHLHVIIATEKPIDPFDVDGFFPWLRERWNGAVHRRLGSAAVGSFPHDVQAEELTDVEAGVRYLSKFGLEITDAFMHKKARDGRMTPWGMLAEMAAQRYREDARTDRLASLWEDWRKATFGQRALTWSRKWRKECGLAKDEPDAVIVAREGLEGDVSLAIPPRYSRQLLQRPHVNLALRRMVEARTPLPLIVERVGRMVGFDAAAALEQMNDEQGETLARIREQREEKRALLATMRATPAAKEARTMRKADDWLESCARTTVRGMHKGDAERAARRARAAEREARHQEWLGAMGFLDD